MAKWLFAALLLLGAHFAASYLVPLDSQAQQEFGGLLRWAWPWSDGDRGLLGQVTVSSGVPFSGLVLAATAAVLFSWRPWQWWGGGFRLAGGGCWL